MLPQQSQGDEMSLTYGQCSICGGHLKADHDCQKITVSNTARPPEDREWWMAREIERLTAEVQALREVVEAAEKARKEMLACDCGFGEYYCDWNHCKYNIHA